MTRGAGAERCPVGHERSAPRTAGCPHRWACAPSRPS